MKMGACPHTVDAALAEMTVENIRDLVMKLEQQLSQPGLGNVMQLDTGRTPHSDSRSFFSFPCSGIIVRTFSTSSLTAYV
jgi:hypothetical protein